MPEAKHKHLLDDYREVRRWYDNLARGSIITADERLRRLGRICDTLNKGPLDLIEEKRKSPEEFDNFVLDFVSESLNKGFKATYVRNNVVSLKSWLAHFGLKVDKKITLPVEDGVDETVPSTQELSTVLRHCDLRSRTIAALMAFSGLRPESIGNYLGNDGIRLKDLPELTIGETPEKIKFEKIPSMVVVRRTLSKARHQYFSFLPVEGCRYICEYLQSRVRESEQLGPESPVVGHVRYNLKHKFMQTTKLSFEVKKAISAAGFSWRPYILRSYFETQMMIAESKGKVMRDYRVFFMGHKGDIEHRYSLNKGRLPEPVIQDLRESYDRSSQFLETEIRATDNEAKQKAALNERLLMVAGYTTEQLQKMDIPKRTDQEIADLARKRLFGVQGGSDVPSPKTQNRQVPIAAGRLEEFLERGFRWEANLPDGRILMQSPGSA